MGAEFPNESYTRTHIRWQTPEPGWMEFDAILRQTVDHDGEVTEHPVDRDAVITDHYRRVTVPLTIETLITNSPLSLPATHTGNAQAVTRVTDLVLPRPIFPGAPTSVGGFDIQAKQLYSIGTLDFVSSGASASQRSDLDRVNLMYQELRAIQEEARVLSVYLHSIDGPGTGGAYESMLLKRFNMDQDPTMANGVSLVLEFKQVIFANVLTDDISAQLPKKKRSNQATDAGGQAAAEKTDDKAAEERSRSLLDRAFF